MPIKINKNILNIKYLIIFKKTETYTIKTKHTPPLILKLKRG